jgi:tRNA (cytidine/uridine-2'-O-)-methyltransferase
VFHLILYQPEIPPNTGNVIRLSANVGSTLHLIHPLGFSLDESRLRRAGLDYADLADVREHASLEACLATLAGVDVYALTTKASRSCFDVSYGSGDAFLLGPETRGLPQALLASWPSERLLRVPMRPSNRSLNLSNTAAIVLYEAWRQLGFVGAAVVNRR